MSNYKINEFLNEVIYPLSPSTSLVYPLYRGNKDNKFPKLVEAFESPWFDDEDDYHSALLTWLNESDEEYILEKDDKEGILTIVRL